MRYQVLACDYDGTLAHDGQVNDTTVAALKRLLVTGRRLVLVTAARLPQLIGIFPYTTLFDWIVAENGGLVHCPSTGEQTALGPPPDDRFLRELHRRRVTPLSVGRVVVATWEPHEKTVLEVIHDLGLELQVTFNKGAVMMLPTGINKATGLTESLKRMGISPEATCAIGDAENDHAFLRLCGCAVAVANAIPAIKCMADFITRGDHGAGVVELIDEMIANDLAGR